RLDHVAGGDAIDGLGTELADGHGRRWLLGTWLPSRLQLRHPLASDDLGQLHRRLVERIHTHEPPGENRFEHQMHHQRPDTRLVKPIKVENAYRPPGAAERLGNRLRLRSHQLPPPTPSP